MNVYKLIIGTIILIFGYAFYQGGASLLQLYEAIFYTLVVLVAYGVKKPILLIFIPLIMGSINLGLGTSSLVLEPILASMLENISIESNQISFVFTIAILAVLGALIFCFILDFKEISNNFTKKTYILIPLLCLFSATPFYFLENGEWAFILHKVTWVVMFSIGIYITERNSSDTIPKDAQAM